ncbi:MAG TPA: 3'(2'),5'-bisphosphate nucleotidase CysQ [Pyrinomonadaceae bacterium]|jgi:3'(2'), 5'-bisphosphate nucleotidase|nr:3'(2'),5'-bisphosphate nucleotidase CysQ [Pyrinomonadaceae bacterium]
MPNTESRFTRETQIVIELARAAGAVLLRHYHTPFLVEQKMNALQEMEEVTAADREANEMIVERLSKEFPDDGILAEESTDTERRLEKERVWLIDPMDGTKNFVQRDGDFAVQIGLSVSGQSVVGAVYQPVRDVLYWAEKGVGSWIEDAKELPRQMTVSSQTNPHQMILASSRSHRSPRMERVVNLFGFKNEVRRGSVGVKIGLITEQEADLYLHLSPSTKQWDTCAPEIILHEAGGRLTDLFGQPLRYNGVRIDNRNGIVATNGAAHESVIEKLQPLLQEFGRLPV